MTIEAQGRLRRTMVVAQVALSLVLLTAGGLVGRSFERLLRADPGFEPAGVLTFRAPATASRYPTDTAVVALHERLERELAAIPGVTAVGGGSALPLTAGANQSTMRFPGAPGNSGDAALIPSIRPHLEDPDAVIAEGARWALDQIARSRSEKMQAA